MLLPLHVALVEAVVLQEEGMRAPRPNPGTPPPTPLAVSGHEAPTCLGSGSITWEPSAAV